MINQPINTRCDVCGEELTHAYKSRFTLPTCLGCQLICDEQLIRLGSSFDREFLSALFEDVQFNEFSLARYDGQTEAMWFSLAKDSQAENKLAVILATKLLISEAPVKPFPTIIDQLVNSFTELMG